MGEDAVRPGRDKIGNRAGSCVLGFSWGYFPFLHRRDDYIQVILLLEVLGKNSLLEVGAEQGYLLKNIHRQRQAGG